PVLALLRRPRIDLDAEDLLPDEGGEDRFELLGGPAHHGGQRAAGERLAEDRRVLHEAPGLNRKAVEPRGDEGVQRLGYVERPDWPRRAVARAFERQEATVDQHPGRLDGIERHALGPGQDLVPDV